MKSHVFSLYFADEASAIEVKAPTNVMPFSPKKIILYTVTLIYIPEVRMDFAAKIFGYYIHFN